jgi:hypothetical protein
MIIVLPRSCRVALKNTVESGLTEILDLQIPEKSKITHIFKKNINIVQRKP